MLRSGQRRRKWVESKKNRMEIEAKIEGLNDATKLAAWNILPYVFWAVSAQGRAENLGEVVAEKWRRSASRPSPTCRLSV